MENSNFFQSSKKIVKKFLNNVIAVDDQLSFGQTIVNIASQANDEFADFDQIVNDSSGLGIPLVTNLRSAPIDNPLNYQDLSIAFSNEGINCCAFKPDPARDITIDNAATRIMEGSRNSDINILDWQMDDHSFNVEGTTAIDGLLAITSIEKILASDKAQNGRLRLIVIYTGFPNLPSITETISERLIHAGYNNFTKNNNIRFESENLKFCHIAIIEKQIEVELLVDTVITLFTKLTIGLLSNATLSAIGELRNKTHHILHTFNKDLDPAYLSHVVGLFSSPQVREKAHEIAFDYATDLISEEIKSNLQISQSIAKDLNFERLTDWVDFISIDQQNDFFQIQIGDDQPVFVTSARVRNLLSTESDEQLINTLSEAPEILRRNAKTLKKFTDSKIQINLQGINHLPHENLSAIECKRRDLYSLNPSSPQPTIKQGSILKRGKDEYYICLQPLCDSIRIQKETNFIFLRIEKNDTKFTHVLKNKDGSFIKLKIKPGTKDIHIFKLTPDARTNTIKVMKKRQSHVIEYMKNDNQPGFLYWVGEFKSNIAQDIANQVAEKLSRIGLDKNEWLRLM